MDIHKLIGKLPRPKNGFMLPSHHYTGPYNLLEEQLNENDLPKREHLPFNSVDRISMQHDICYRDNPSIKGKHTCDDTMLKRLTELKAKGWREHVDKKIVQTIIGTKRRLGFGVNKWSDKLADELHRPVKRKFRKRRVYVKGTNKIHASDLVDMQAFSKSNNGYRYILMIIDTFSKYGWAIPIKTKKGTEVVKAFSKLWMKEKPPQKLWIDKGLEYWNADMKRLAKKKHVAMYTTENEEKSTIVERWNRTIKRIMFKYFTANNTRRYIDVLPDIIHKYNNTYHRSIKCKPAAARQPSKHDHVYKALFGDDEIEARKRTQAVEKAKFSIGDRVRISKKKKQFEKGFTPNFTEEVFIVDKVQTTDPVTYKLLDLQGEVIKGSFYEEELQKTNQEIFRIEKVIRKRKRNGIREVYVKWLGYQDEFNSWIPLTDIKDGS